MLLRPPPHAPPSLPPTLATPCRRTRQPPPPPRGASSARRREAPSHRLPAPPPRAWWSSLFGGGGSDEGDGSAAAAGRPPLPPPLDDGDLPFPRSLLAGTHVAARPLALAYRASRDGWSALDFHAAADFRGPLVVVLTTADGARCGGFHSVGVTASDDYFASMSPFLFALPEGQPPIILPKINGAEAALYDYRRGGPQWGSDALVVGAPSAPVMGGFAGPDSPTVGAGDLKSARSRLGLQYAAREDGRTLFGGNGGVDGGRCGAALVEVEAYCAPDLAALYG